MSYVPFSYRNTYPVAWPDERYSPVPGWGMRGSVVGSKRVGVGGFGMDVEIDLPIVGKQIIKMPVEAAIAQGIEAAWPAIQTKLEASLNDALDAGKRAMHADVVTAGAVILGAIALSAWWVKRK